MIMPVKTARGGVFMYRVYEHHYDGENEIFTLTHVIDFKELIPFDPRHISYGEVHQKGGDFIMYDLENRMKEFKKRILVELENDELTDYFIL
jgi:hypothetical protein